MIGPGERWSSLGVGDIIRTEDIEWCFMVGWVGFEIYGVQWKMTVKKYGGMVIR